eukprot:scaffold91223_cov69-Phaeocystis_antarctica.AAC.2
MERVFDLALSLQYLGLMRIVASDNEPCVRLSLPLTVVSKHVAPSSGSRQGAHLTLATSPSIALSLVVSPVHVMQRSSSTSFGLVPALPLGQGTGSMAPILQ